MQELNGCRITSTVYANFFTTVPVLHLSEIQHSFRYSNTQIAERTKRNIKQENNLYIFVKTCNVCFVLVLLVFVFFLTSHLANCWFCLSKLPRHKFYLKILDILSSTLFPNFPASQTSTARPSEEKHWPRVNMKISQWVKHCSRSSTSEILPEKTITLLLISPKRGPVGQLCRRVRQMDLGVIEQI